MAETQADETDEATEDEAMNDEPSYAFAKGYGRFGIGYTRLATALGNFEQGDIGAESAVVAHWLTSGLRIAMSRTGWNLISTRYSLTKVPSPQWVLQQRISSHSEDGGSSLQPIWHDSPLRGEMGPAP